MFGYTHCYPHISKIQNRGVSDMKRPESLIAKGTMHSPCVYLQMEAQQKKQNKTKQNKKNKPPIKKRPPNKTQIFYGFVFAFLDSDLFQRMCSGYSGECISTP